MFSKLLKPFGGKQDKPAKDTASSATVRKPPPVLDVTDADFVAAGKTIDGQVLFDFKDKKSKSV